MRRLQPKAADADGLSKMKKHLIWILPVLAGILWGSAGVFVRTLEGYGFSEATVVESRVGLASVLLGLVLAVYDRSLFHIRLKEFWVFAGGGILGMLGLNLCYNRAIQMLSLSLAAVLLALSPVFVLLLSAALFHEKITGRKLLCAVLAITGCFLVSGMLEEGAGIQASGTGILIGACGGFFYALYSIFSKEAARREYQGLTVTFYCLLLVAVILLPFCDWQMIEDMVLEAPLKNGIFLLVHSLCTSVLPYVFYTLSVQYMEAGKAAILAAGEPVAAMIFGLLFFGEMPTLLSVSGLVLTVIAMALLI